MSVAKKSCSVCGKEFVVKTRRQVERRNGTIFYFCSPLCVAEFDASSTQRKRCSVCNKEFTPEFVYQSATIQGASYDFCSVSCRKSVTDPLEKKPAEKKRKPTKIAVLNQKGGTGKTTTSVSLSAAIAAAGKRVLLIDVDTQGHVGVSLGIETKDHKTVNHIIVDKLEPKEVVVSARPNLDIIVGNPTLAACEITLARIDQGQETVLKQRLGDDLDYDFIFFDCGPSLSLLNLNALTYADYLLVPVSCDFLSLVGVRQVLQTLKRVNQVLLHPIEIIGILPTMLDMRNQTSVEAYRSLQGHFGEKVLPSIRLNTRLKEAPGKSQTIFEYDPEGRGSIDYKRVADVLMTFRDKKLEGAS